MNRPIVLLSIFLAAFLHSPVAAQLQPASGEVFIRRDFLYSRAKLRLRDGTVWAGLYAGLSGDRVRLISGGREMDVSLADIREFEIEAEPDPMKGALLGTVLGAYLGTMILAHAEGEPVGYLEGNSDYFPASLLLALPGCAIFSLVDVPGTETFSIEGSDEEVAEETRRLRDFLMGTPRSRRFHLTVQGGWMSRRLSQETPGVGLFPPNPYGWYYAPYGWDQKSSVNLLRKIQLTRTLRPWLEAGVALIQLSEPSFTGYKTIGQTDTTISFLGYSETLRATSYTLVAGFEPFRRIFPPSVKWKVGTGIGLAEVELTSTRMPGKYTRRPGDGYYPYWEGGTDAPVEEGFTSIATVLTLFTTLEIYPYSFFSIGFGADYTFCPGLKYPAVPEWNLEERPIGNGCIGFTFGIHF